MKQIIFKSLTKFVLLISILTQLNLNGYAQSGLDKNGREVSDQASMINKYGAKGSGTAVTKFGQSFTATPVLATLTTTAVSSILSSTASSGGDITNGGGVSVIARGVVWNTSSSPTIALSTKTSDDAGTGTFTSTLTGLTASTLYYVRAYATNSVGTSYGNEVTFTTAIPPPNIEGGNAICDGTRTTVVREVVGAEGKIWMDRNLGASRAATSPTDYLAYGCLFQWGRGNDGHASITWTGATSGTPVNGTTATLSPTDIPGHSLFIQGVNTPNDWRTSINKSLWQGAGGVNNPCPAGFRVPTIAELVSQIPDHDTAVNGVLKFTVPGGRSANGGFQTVGGYTSYFSSTINPDYPSINPLCRIIDLNSVSIFERDKASGNPVRCIKN